MLRYQMYLLSRRVGRQAKLLPLKERSWMYGAKVCWHSDDEIPKKKKKRKSTYVGDENWVPPAYRGVKADVEVRLRREKRKAWQEKQEAKFEPQETGDVRLQKKQEKGLAGLYIDIMKTVPPYRALFHTSSSFQPPPEMELNQKTIMIDGLFDFARNDKRLMKLIGAALDKIHEGDVVADLQLLKSSEDAFLKLLDHLMNMCATLVSRSHSEVSCKDRVVEQAEFCLVQLVEMGRTREKLYENVMDNHAQLNEGEQSEKAPALSSEKGKAEKNEFHFIAQDDERSNNELESIAEKIKKTLLNGERPNAEEKRSKAEPEDDLIENQQSPKHNGCCAVNGNSKASDASDVSLVSEDGTKIEGFVEEALPNSNPDFLQQFLVETKQLFFKVIVSMASAAHADAEILEKRRPISKKDEVDFENDFSVIRFGVKMDGMSRKIYENAAWRMIDLLSLMPEQWREDPGINSVRCIMEMLKKAGTSDCARKCHEIFKKGNPQDLDFNCVLESYLEAVRYEDDQQERVSIVREAFDALNAFWDSNLKICREDRIIQAAIILNCISVGTVAHKKGMCYKADVLAKRALGKIAYAKLDKDLHTKEPQFLQPEALPLLDNLVQVYALSENDFKVEIAKRMLEYMLRQQEKLDGDQMDYTCSFPSVDTFNSVLYALLMRYNGKSHAEVDAARLKADFRYAQERLDFICQLNGRSCAADALTQHLIFNLLDVAYPKDSDDIVEDLLLKLETKHYISGTIESAISLSTYHRVFKYWLRSAKAQRKVQLYKTAFQKAFLLLEKLEIQSTPLVLNSQALASFRNPHLYNLSLKPEKLTYKLVLQICAETNDPIHQEAVVPVAFEVYRRMKVRGFSTDEETVTLLTKCLSRLPEGSETRLNLERLIPEFQQTRTKGSKLENHEYEVINTLS